MTRHPAPAPAPVVVARGNWVYADTVVRQVLVVRLSYDFWYEIGLADDRLADDEMPHLNEDGHAFYVLFHEMPNDGPVWPDSIGFLQPEQARAAAQARVPTPITWTVPDPAEDSPPGRPAPIARRPG